VISKLAPSLKEIFSSDDSDFAKLFSGYMTPPTGLSQKSAFPVTDTSKDGLERAAKK
jgi:hypothetical protein